MTHCDPYGMPSSICLSLLEPFPGARGEKGKETVTPGFPTAKQVQCNAGGTGPCPLRALPGALAQGAAAGQFPGQSVRGVG